MQFSDYIQKSSKNDSSSLNKQTRKRPNTKPFIRICSDQGGRMLVGFFGEADIENALKKNLNKKLLMLIKKGHTVWAPPITIPKILQPLLRSI